MRARRELDLGSFLVWMCLRSCEEEAIFSWVRVRVRFRQVEILKKGILCDGNTAKISSDGVHFPVSKIKANASTQCQSIKMNWVLEQRGKNGMK